MSATFAPLLPQLQRAQLLLQQGRGSEAWLILAPLRQAMNSQGQALRLYALSAQGVGRIDEAASALKRILELEGNPADILGALADMLGQAGRHAEALGHWDRLVALHPELADAHLNRAITAAESGQHELAIAAADEGLQRFKGHARLLAVKALALKNAGRVDESVALFEQAVAADPMRPLTRHNQAVALRAACRFEEACEAYAEAERLGMRGAQFHANWAAAALEAGQADEAAELYRKALAEDPAHQESLDGLTRVQIEFRQSERAFDHYEESLRQRDFALVAWYDWIEALLNNDRYERAAEVAGQAARRYPDERRLLAMEAFGAGISGDAALQLHRIEQAYGSADEAPLPWMALLALRAGLPEKAAGFAQRIIEGNPNSQGAWSTLSIAWRLLDDPREHWLCDYDRFVMEADILPVDQAESAEEYAGRVADALMPLHRARQEPGKSSLRGGTQTGGNLVDYPEPIFASLREAALRAAECCIGGLSEDPLHPFVGRKSESLGFSSSWSSRLTAAGGYHESHYHERGWMSSAYYVRLPNYDDQARSRRDGWLQFGAPPSILGIDLDPRRIVEPAIGKILLFPSYMLHGTIPFARGDRMTVSFDYVPQSEL